MSFDRVGVTLRDDEADVGFVSWSAQEWTSKKTGILIGASNKARNYKPGSEHLRIEPICTAKDTFQFGPLHIDTFVTVEQHQIFATYHPSPGATGLRRLAWEIKH